MADISEVATNVHRLSTVLGRLADNRLQETYGFGMTQFKIIWMLNKHQDGVIQTTIASWLDQTEAAISRQINLLQAEKLIEMRVDSKNHRNHIIVLSTRGKKFAEGAMKILMKEYKPLFSGLTSQEQEILSRLLEKIFFKACKAL